MLCTEWYKVQASHRTFFFARPRTLYKRSVGGARGSLLPSEYQRLAAWDQGAGCAEPLGRFLGGRSTLIQQSIDFQALVFGPQHDPFCSFANVFYGTKTTMRPDLETGARAAQTADAKQKSLRDLYWHKKHRFGVLARVARFVERLTLKKTFRKHF